jgi:hypothetical protein
MGFNSRQVPQRVFALQSADAENVYSYGVGTYVGDLPAPWYPEEPDETTLASILNFIRGEDEREEPFSVGMTQYMLDQGKITAEEAEAQKAEAYRRHAAERERPLNDRIKDAYALLIPNPCIQLDDGSTVWGAQCWWGPEERYEEKVGGRTVIMVPAPETNPRWRDDA